MIECSTRSSSEIGKILSNLYPHAFELSGIQFGSIEGFLQSLKFQDEAVRKQLYPLYGVKAWKTGQAGNDWKKSQIVFFTTSAIQRQSESYQYLLTSAYDACWKQNVLFREALIKSMGEELYHQGVHDSHDTVLTVSEYIRQLYRLRG